MRKLLFHEKIDRLHIHIKKQSEHCGVSIWQEIGKMDLDFEIYHPPRISNRLEPVLYQTNGDLRWTTNTN